MEWNGGARRRPTCGGCSGGGWKKRPRSSRSSANSYEFQRARKLNRSARIGSKLELSDRDDGAAADLRQKWQSIGALGQEERFGRLKKSYATMRKSFRLQLSERRRDFDFETHSGHMNGDKGNFIGQLGQGAAKLFRGVYGKNQRASNHLELDSCHVTDGSFKVLSSTAHYGEFNDSRLTTSTGRKSEAEMEIRQRLQRSKRRILPSASYRAPDCERACEGLNLDELEEIKRDNLRLTLRSQKLVEPRLNLADDKARREGVLSAERSEADEMAPTTHEEVATLDCSCKKLDCLDSSQNYCSCVSISSSFSSLDQLAEPAAASSLDDGGLERAAQLDSMVTESHSCHNQESRTLEVAARLPQANDAQQQLNSSRASSGLLVGEKIEDKLRKMFDSMGEFNFDKETFVELEKVCGGRPSCCVGLSPTSSATKERAEKTTTAGSLQQLLAGRKREQQEQSEELGRPARKPQLQQLERRGDLNGEGEARNCSTLGGANTLARIASHQVSQHCNEMQQAAATSVQSEQQQKSAATVAEQTDTGIVELDQQPQQFACLPGSTRSSGSVSGGGQAGGKSKHRHHHDTTHSPRNIQQVQDNNRPSVEAENEEANYCREQQQLDSSREEIMMHGVTTNEAPDVHEATSRNYVLVDPLYGDEHLYSSIRGYQTPSPELYYPNPRWQRKLSYDEFNDNDQRLFNEQLNSSSVAERQQIYHHLKQQQLLECSQMKRSTVVAKNNNNIKPKRSLLSRLKHLIAPVGKATSKQANEIWTPQQLHQRELNDDGGNSSRRSSRQMARWQKSATLTSKSTQNLIGSSLRYLSASRKSVNLAYLENEDFPDGARKSLINNGFLTLGRRATNPVHGGHELVSQIFKERNALDRRRFGSADSLPSADSGLSCGNLQNSSSSDENYVALRSSNLYTTRSQQFRPTTGQRSEGVGGGGQQPVEVVGRARAKVDCNPCAYDKEALVFKRGDVIDILERHPSGTWIGRCDGQIGHFKFINVSEISYEEDEDENESDSAANTSPSSARTPTTNSSSSTTCIATTSGNGIFVTKLEIRSKNTESKGASGLELQQASPPSNGNTSTINRRSLSVNTINEHNTHHATTTSSACNSNRQGSFRGEPADDMAGSNETIMSSLEQLLFAIGLAGEQVSINKRCRETTTADDLSVKEQEQEHAFAGCNESSGCNPGKEELGSYLAVLNKGGINTLDSFSAIDDWHELEQIGIVDDEHQRRLLMAARIIRQASRAAKLDFVENHRTNGNNNKTGAGETLEPAAGLLCEERASQSDKTVANMATTIAAGEVTRPQTTRGASGVVGGDGNTNEPIYVNLVNVRAVDGQQNSKGPVVVAVGRDNNVPSLDPLHHPAADRRHQHHQLQARTELDCAALQAPSPAFQRHHRYQAEQRGTSHAREVNLNSINQSDRYHPQHRRRLSTQHPTHDTTHMAVMYDDDDRHCGPLDPIGSESAAFQPPLNRVHSVRVQNHGNGRYSSQQKIKPYNDLTSVQHTTNRQWAAPPPRTSGSVKQMAGTCSPRQSSFVVATGGVPNNRSARMILGDNHDESQMFSRHPDWPTAEYKNNHQHQQLMRVSRRQQQNYNHHHHHHHQQQPTTTPNLGSQINSQSAYDLRLDLSHFFS